jgi:hypothetical protein
MALGPFARRPYGKRPDRRGGYGPAGGDDPDGLPPRRKCLFYGLRKRQNETGVGIEAAKNDDRAVAVLRDLSQRTKGGYPAELALLHLGKVLQRQGKAEEARRTWQDLMARYPQATEAAEARTLVEGKKP